MTHNLQYCYCRTVAAAAVVVVEEEDYDPPEEMMTRVGPDSCRCWHEACSYFAFAWVGAVCLAVEEEFLLTLPFPVALSSSTLLLLLLLMATMSHCY